MIVLSFMRFKQQPPSPKEATPADRIDMFYSPAEGKFVARDSAGNAVKFDAVGGGGTTAITGTTTNDNAAAGILGEYKESSGSPSTGLVNLGIINAASLSLGAGDWEVEGSVLINTSAAAAAVISTNLGTASASITSSGGADFDHLINPVSGFVSSSPLRRRFSLASTTTVYLCLGSDFSSGSMSLFSFLMTARRVR